jgi:tyrosine-protein phosphatase YwqE
MDYPPITDFSTFGTDIHSHLIPGIDDGSKSIEESLQYIRALQELGFHKIITTPHVMADSYRNTREIIMQGLEELREAVRQAGITVELEAAAEYYFDENFFQAVENNDLMTFGNKYVLFEISFMNPPENIMQVIFDLQVKGYKPLLAHPERYPFWQQKFSEYHKLKEAGALFQLNINSLCGYYNNKVKKIAERLIDENMIDFIGSDLHGQRHLDAMRKCVHEKYLYKLATQKIRNREL